MEIVVDKQNQFQIPSSEIGRTIFRSEFMDLKKKKRKLQSEQLGLPSPKHKCGDRNFNSDSCLHHHPTANNGANMYIASDSEDDDSGLESVKDSNSFLDESDPSISTSAESKMDSRSAKTWSSDWLCTPSNDFNRIYNNSTDGGSSSSHSIIIDPQNSNPILLRPYQDDDLQEFGSLMEDGFLEQGMECDEKASDEHCYVLSSGRWTVDQGNVIAAQKREEKLTIDKEFEQYFSMLIVTGSVFINEPCGTSYELLPDLVTSQPSWDVNSMLS